MATKQILQDLASESLSCLTTMSGREVSLAMNNGVNPSASFKYDVKNPISLTLKIPVNAATVRSAIKIVGARYNLQSNLWSMNLSPLHGESVVTGIIENLISLNVVVGVARQIESSPFAEWLKHSNKWNCMCDVFFSGHFEERHEIQNIIPEAVWDSKHRAWRASDHRAIRFTQDKIDHIDSRGWFVGVVGEFDYGSIAQILPWSHLAKKTGNVHLLKHKDSQRVVSIFSHDDLISYMTGFVKNGVVVDCEPLKQKSIAAGREMWHNLIADGFVATDDDACGTKTLHHLKLNTHWEKINV